MDRGSSLPCVLEQKVRAGDTAGVGSGGTESGKLNALRVLLEVTWDGSREAWGDEWQNGMNPDGLFQVDKGT
jgi:hypothetical protein